MPSSDPPAVAEESHGATLQVPQSKPENLAEAKGKGKGKGKAGSEAPAGVNADDSLTPAERKAKAKAEKAARRAQKVDGVAPAVNSSSASAGPHVQNNNAQAQAAGRRQHNRSGSTAAVDARNLPIRGDQRSATPKSTPDASPKKSPKDEGKTPEFFRHLYKPRVDSIADASSLVHPAVLALGLQMGNYTICGSCARLVAMLQTFKRVSTFDPSDKYSLLISLGYRIIHNTAWEYSHKTSHITCSWTKHRLSPVMSANLNINGQCYSVAEARNLEN